MALGGPQLPQGVVRLPRAGGSAYNRGMSRLDQLQTLLAKSPSDPFLLYGIALEHKKLDQTDSALQYLERAIAADGQYCYAYYQKGQILAGLGQTDAARASYLAGISAAMVSRDSHAQGELQAALEELD